MVLCKSLCSAGANPTICDFNGYDALAYARQSSSGECLNYLMHVAQSFSSTYTSFPGNEDRQWFGGYNLHDMDPSLTMKPIVESEGPNVMDMMPSNESSTMTTWERKGPVRNIDSTAVTRPLAKDNDPPLHVNHALEEELLQHLLSIEKKLNSKDENTSKDTFEKAGQHISEMSNKLLQAQADLATKQMELMTVGFEMATMREKYDSLITKTRPLVDTVEKIFGESTLYASEASPLDRDDFHSKTDTMKDEIIVLQRRVQTLELENRHLFEEKSSKESDSTKLQNELNNRIASLCSAAESKDLEIAALKQAESQWMHNDGSSKNNASIDRDLEQFKLISAQYSEQLARSAAEKESLRCVYEQEIAALKQAESQWMHYDGTSTNNCSNDGELEQLKLISAQYSEQLARSAAEKESLRCFYEQEMLSLKSDKEFSSKTIQSLREMLNTTEGKLYDLERTLSLERETNTELSRKNARALDEVKIEKDGLINKWMQEFVLLEDRHDIVIRDLEISRTKNVETDLKLQEVSSMIHEAKIALAANEKLHRMLQSETDKRKVLHNQVEDMKGRIRVYVRIRPISSEENKKGFKCAVFKDESKVAIIRPEENGHDPKYWEFDCVFGGRTEEGNNQVSVFKDTCNLITSVVDGYNVCIMAYGQTGTLSLN